MTRNFNILEDKNLQSTDKNYINISYIWAVDQFDLAVEAEFKKL